MLGDAWDCAVNGGCARRSWDDCQEAWLQLECRDHKEICWSGAQAWRPSGFGEGVVWAGVPQRARQRPWWNHGSKKPHGPELGGGGRSLCCNSSDIWCRTSCNLMLMAMADCWLRWKPWSVNRSAGSEKVAPWCPFVIPGVNSTLGWEWSPSSFAGMCSNTFLAFSASSSPTSKHSWSFHGMISLWPHQNLKSTVRPSYWRMMLTSGRRCPPLHRSCHWHAFARNWRRATLNCPCARSRCLHAMTSWSCYWIVIANFLN